MREWIQVAPKLDAETHIYSLVVYNGRLYGGMSNGQLYEYYWDPRQGKLVQYKRVGYV